jgi:FMN phosphatase YigB (HAD superfamily)
MHQSYKLILASNYVAPWARNILESNGWIHYFCRCVISSDCGFRKPSRQFFFELLKHACVSPSEVLMIGDSVVNDFYGATAAGMQAVLLDRDGACSSHGFLGRVPSFSSLEELADTLTPEHMAPLPD